MTKPRSIAWGEGATAGRLEYVKSRGVMRLTSGASSDRRELTLRAFCDEVGIRAEAVTAPTYLLFAGKGASSLTIYDEHCVRTDYGPGETYLGGNAPHLARNETTADLNVAITYVYSSASQTAGTALAAPAGCNVR